MIARREDGVDMSVDTARRSACATLPHEYQPGEFHRFEAGGREFLYLVPAGAIFELDDDAKSVLDLVREGKLTHNLYEERREVIEELYQSHVIISRETIPDPPQNPPANFPLQTLVLNLTNQCNLSCQYCYEFGEDKVATPEGKKKFMDFETAKQSVQFLLAESAGRGGIHITFFGGETLMNFPLLKQVVTYATDEAAKQGRSIDFSLTTNATLLTPTIIGFLSDNNIGVTVSMDGPAELHDKLRVFANGKGSYDIIAPRVRELIAGHKTRPITARVTLTAGNTDVIRIYRHLKEDLGFPRSGFRAGHDVAGSPVRDQRNGHGRRAGTIPQAGRRVSGIRVARRDARLLERQ